MRRIRQFIHINQGIIVPAVVILFCILSFAIGIVPGMRKVQLFISSATILGRAIGVLEEKRNVLRATTREELEDYAIAAISAIPTDKSLGSLFSTIDGLTSREGVTVTTVSLGTVGSVATESAIKRSTDEKRLGVGIIPFSIVIEGPIENVRNVVDNAVKIRRFLRVRNFDLTLDAKTGLTRSTLQMDAYYVPIPKTVVTVTDPLTGLTSEEMEILERVKSMPILSGSSFVATGSSSIPLSPLTSDPFAP